MNGKNLFNDGLKNNQKENIFMLRKTTNILQSIYLKMLLLYFIFFFLFFIHINLKAPEKIKKVEEILDDIKIYEQ